MHCLQDGCHVCYTENRRHRYVLSENKRNLLIIGHLTLNFNELVIREQSTRGFAIVFFLYKTLFLCLIDPFSC